MRETKGVMCSAQCGRFTGYGVRAESLPQEASPVLQPGTLTAGFCVPTQMSFQLLKSLIRQI